jgi:hypothetical protein
MAEPYEGANILGAGIAGYQTPVGSGLTPEQEQVFRESYIKQLTALSKLKMEMATQSITSNANVTVSVLNAVTSGINSAVNAARIGQADNALQANALLELYGPTLGAASGMSTPHPKVAEKLIAGGDSLLNQMVAGGASENSIIKLIAQHQNRLTPQQFAEALVENMGSKNRSYAAGHTTSIDSLKRSGVDIKTLVDTKKLATEQMSSASQKGLQYAMQSLGDDPWSQQVLNYLGQNSDRIITNSIVGDRGVSTRDRDIFVSPQEEQDAARYQSDAEIKLQALTEKMESFSSGVSPELSKTFGELIGMSKKLVADGPIAFAESLEKMPTPLSVQMTEQKLNQQLQQIDNPTDPLSQAVGLYASKIPFMETYMAAMGFDDTFKAVEYLRSHPDDRKQYFKIVRALSQQGELDELKNPEAIQARLRVAGSSDNDSIFRTSILTKPIERLLGIGINKPAAWRRFSGTNTSEQLENAIAAIESVGVEEFDRSLPSYDQAPGALGAQDLSDEADIPVEAIEFAQELSPGQRKRTMSAAKKFLSKIDPEYVDKDKEDDSKDRAVLPGFEPKAVPARQPVQLTEAESPTEPTTAAQRFGFGGRARTESLADIEARLRKERDQASVPAAGSTNPPSSGAITAASQDTNRVTKDDEAAFGGPGDFMKKKNKDTGQYELHGSDTGRP